LLRRGDITPERTDRGPASAARSDRRLVEL
ncbi:MAG: hypothetical protein QOG94_3120, partial [Solirubrobacteraceae bacterium]|nr:hypothetical protein [Solirubrobacteraceae bacterium]